MLPAALSLAMPRQPLKAGAGRVIGSSPYPGRVPNDFYPTPASAVRAFLATETFAGSVWEPACGDGAIAKVLEAHGYDTVATDLIDRGYGRSGVDFLETIWPRGRHIITNPPYGNGLADAFVKHALKLASITGGRVAMLLNIASLCHAERTTFWQQRPPSVIYALDDCVCFPEGRPEAATRFTHLHRYIWAVWEPETVQVSSTIFKWLATGPFTDRALRFSKRQTKQQSTRRSS